MLSEDIRIIGNNMSNLKEKILFKAKAALIHLLVSLLVFTGIAYVIIFEWYPQALFTAEGGLQGIKLMAAIDLVLGPSLTFIIISKTKGKLEIVFDLAVIVIIQISALVWGGLQVYSQRPVALVMWEDVFYTVTEDYYSKQEVSLDEVTKYSDEKPRLIYADSKNSVEQLNEIQRLNELKIPPYGQVHLYGSLKDNFSDMLPVQITQDDLDVYAKEHIIEEGQHVFLGKAKHKDLLVYLDANANLIAIKGIDKVRRD